MKILIIVLLNTFVKVNDLDPRGRTPWENTVEKRALESMRQIVETGQERIDRTGVGTRSLFGMQWKYDLTDTFPIWT